VISRRRIQRSPTLDDDLSVRDARREFFRRAGLPEDGGYSRLSLDGCRSTGLLGDVTLFLACAVPSLVGLAVLVAGISAF
jgi:hypothetical protein